MAKVLAVWAIDIGQAALKGLKLIPSETPDQVIAEAFDYVEYPKILSQPDADPEELIREALITFLGRNDLKNARVAVSVPGQAGLVKFIKLPPVEKKRIPDIVKFEAKQQIPFALEEVIWDYQQIGAEDEEEAGDDDFTMAEVGLFAMKRDQIYRALQPFKAAGIEVDVVQMSPIALYNFAAFEALAAKSAEPGSIVLLDIGADNTDLIITDGIRIWQRNVPIGGNHFTRALTKELKLTFAKAEHLKRNATKSPDPRAVFTAMRGVFNDFSSEIGRSIGFYSSINRQAKITKIIGLGNGFKLPGLQKFLQQNLNYEVERLEGFSHLTGEEVPAAPQFVENVMSFAVPYGLAVQGLELGKLRTNLLPPEIEQVRMIRRKKPWALVASVLLMVGFSALFVGDWAAVAKVENPEMKTAVSQAKQEASRGAQLVSAFNSAKDAFNAKKTEGEGLVAATPEGASWPALLMMLNAAMPNPADEYGLDPSAPANQEILRDLRVHVDAIIPRFRSDLNTEWFALPELDGFPKDYMHAYDRTTPPEGEGWVIQIVGHHYNPSPYGPKSKKLTDKERPFAMGPLAYLTKTKLPNPGQPPSLTNPLVIGVLPRLWRAELRQFGIHHATVTWVEVDEEWVSAKSQSGSSVPAAPLLAKATPPATGGSGEMGMPGMDMMMMMGGAGGRMGMMGSGEMMPGMGSGEMMDMMMSRFYGGGMMMPGTKKAEETTLTRTNFMIQLVWQPLAPDTPVKPIEEIQKALAEASKGQGAPKELSESEITKVSSERQKKAIETQVKAFTNVLGAAAKAAPAAAPAEGAPAAPAAPAPDATPK